ncbi:MAG: hypothetical protein PHU47_03725 [Candidatus ainarchaeum sp.]|nr:hypothetical protein [Candidatus ainarchaeum sp.]
MEIKIIDEKYHLRDKVLNQLDKLTIDFITVLDKYNIRYVLISGYVAILFGRSRNSEDIDLFVENIDFETFKKIWTDLSIKFECVILDDVNDAFFEYLNQGLPLRFAIKNTFIPNIEVKIAKMKLDIWALKNKKEVILNNNTLLKISPLELQIPYKLFLSSEKDIEDAKHLYNRFKNKLDQKLFDYFICELKVSELFRKYLL